MTGFMADAGLVAGSFAGTSQDALRNAIKPDVRQGEIEREIHRLLVTAETLESLVDKAVKTVEKVTRGEPETLSGGKGAVESPIPATMLGRDLDSINGRLQSSMNILQSTIQRIEL
jgi:hypothetical protein